MRSLVSSLVLLFLTTVQCSAYLAVTTYSGNTYAGLDQSGLFTGAGYGSTFSGQAFTATFIYDSDDPNVDLVTMTLNGHTMLPMLPYQPPGPFYSQTYAEAVAAGSADNSFFSCCTFPYHYGGLTSIGLGVLDPGISRDPLQSFSLSPFYGSGSLQYSAGSLGGVSADLVVNMVVRTVSAVPEPATWAMLLIGFAGLGFASYRKTRRLWSLSALQATVAAH